ncbi:unnamed protein product [Tetraodon nigroviridis]|uniref:(spotted green pufferfish) hypothetical protein n=1 Tax=Tetraodon nigroviridis TaxID=99883 RepID=Q4S7L3_TETNG|nr:unnamed protein product [Tetraodon nigroviridis]
MVKTKKSAPVEVCKNKHNFLVNVTGKRNCCLFGKASIFFVVLPLKLIVIVSAGAKSRSHGCPINSS